MPASEPIPVDHHDDHHDDVDADDAIFTDPVQMAAARDAALDDELLPYYNEDGPLGPSLTHPLVYMAIGVVPGWANRALRQKKKALTRALREGHHHEVVFLHERPYRTHAFVTFVVGYNEKGRPNRLADFGPDVHSLAARVWTDSENLEQCAKEWKAMLRGAKGLVVVTEEDREAFADLPETLTVYRADFGDGGWSWSLDAKVADFFATRFDADHPVVTGTVAKADVIGYITSRSEAEVIIPHGKVRDIRPYRVKR